MYKITYLESKKTLRSFTGTFFKPMIALVCAFFYLDSSKTQVPGAIASLDLPDSRVSRATCGHTAKGGKPVH